MSTFKAKAYYPRADGFVRIDEPEATFEAVCLDYHARGFKLIECTDDWEDIGPWAAPHDRQ